MVFSFGIVKRYRYLLWLSLCFLVSCNGKPNKLAQNVTAPDVMLKDTFYTYHVPETSAKKINYEGIFPPTGMVTANFSAPFIVEGYAIRVDSIQGYLKVVHLLVDSIWKGDVKQDTIRYMTFNERQVRYYTRQKRLLFLREEKEAYANGDTAAYVPINEVADFLLDADFKRDLLQFQQKLK